MMNKYMKQEQHEPNCPYGGDVLEECTCPKRMNKQDMREDFKQWFYANGKSEYPFYIDQIADWWIEKHNLALKEQQEEIIKKIDKKTEHFVLKNSKHGIPTAPWIYSSDIISLIKE